MNFTSVEESMSKKFDHEAYVARWDSILVPLMSTVIVVSIALVIVMNRASTPDCLRHEYIFCGTESSVIDIESLKKTSHGAKDSGHGAESSHAPH